jgi:hypothetical protein
MGHGPIVQAALPDSVNDTLRQPAKKRGRPWNGGASIRSMVQRSLKAAARRNVDRHPVLQTAQPRVTPNQKDDAPMTVRAQNAGDLSRTINHEANSDWPSVVEIVCYWDTQHKKKGRRRSAEIGSDQFFGTGRFGAPMTGDQLIAIVERLRRAGPKS